MRTTAIVLTASVFLFLNPSANAYRDVIDLGTLGGTKSHPDYINDNGLIVGFAYDSSGNMRSCLFDTSGGGANIDLGILPGCNSSWARYVNNSDQIVGRTDNSSPPYISPKACLFDKTGSGLNKDLGFNDAWSINNKGDIVGESSNRACLYTVDRDWQGNPVPTVINLGTLVGAPLFNVRSIAYSINNNEHIVGDVIYYGSDPFSEEYHACLFDETGHGANKNLGTLGGIQSRALSINDSDHIAGWAQNISGSPRACLFDNTGGGANIDLGTIGDAPSAAYYINNNNQIVGVFDGRACLFDQTGNGNNTDLNTLINPSSGWTLKIAYSVNNNGWIVGVGINPDGDSHAFLLTPEPATMFLFGLGAAVLRKRK